jgi:hypothetical protein
MHDMVAIPQTQQWEALLERRGLLAVARRFGWTPDGQGWRYPVYRSNGQTWHVDDKPIYRWKAFDSGAKPKYRWEPSGLSGQLPPYYLLPGTAAAIARDGSVILASGEPDVLAFRAAQTENVLCWFGEATVPETLASDLRTLGVSRVECYPDLDDTGMLWAAKIRERLAGFKVEICRLPGEMGSKADINKLWIDCGFDVVKFWDVLVQCPPLVVREKVRSADEPKDFPQEFYTDLEQLIGVTKFDRDGWSNALRCPMKDHEHDDSSPGAGWNHEKKILKCFKCGSVYLAKEVAERLNIDWRRYMPRQTALKIVKDGPARSAPAGKPQQTFTWAEAAQSAKDAVTGATTTHEALPIRWANLRKFGGYAELIGPGKVAAIVGDSGDGKTAFMECQADDWRQQGYSGIFWSPEWAKEELIYRAVQRQGGPQFMDIMRHMTFMAVAQRGVPANRNPGKKLSDAALAQFVAVVDAISAWPGKLHFVERAGTNVENIATRIGDIISKCAAAGERIAFACIDYAQLLDAEGSGENDRIKRAMNRVKETTITHQLVTLVGSQIGKTDGRMAGHGAKSGLHAMLYVRSDVFNLVITLNRETDSDGRKSNSATVRVAKNSQGLTGDDRLKLDPARMVWEDVVQQNINLPKEGHV